MEVQKTHVGAYGIIIRDNKIALIKKARGGYKGKLDLPGGGIEFYETPHTAVIREIKEEIGCTVLYSELFDGISVNIKWEFEPDCFEDLHHIGILYKVKIKEDQLKEEPDGLDSNGAAWYQIDELEENMLSPFAWYSLQKLGYK